MHLPLVRVPHKIADFRLIDLYRDGLAVCSCHGCVKSENFKIHAPADFGGISNVIWPPIANSLKSPSKCNQPFRGCHDGEKAKTTKPDGNRKNIKWYQFCFPLDVAAALDCKDGIMFGCYRRKHSLIDRKREDP